MNTLLLAVWMAAGGAVTQLPTDAPSIVGYGLHSVAAARDVQADTFAVRAPTVSPLNATRLPLDSRRDVRAREPIDLIIAGRIRSSAIGGSPVARGAANVFEFAGLPGSLLVAGALYGVGEVAERSDLRDLGVHTGQAIVLAGAATLTGKLVLGRARPHISPDDPYDFELGRGISGDRYQSFPSAHTAAAFAAASLLSVELSDRHPGSRLWIVSGTYGTAALAGLARMLEEQHWASDVVVGALIGAVAGWRVAAYHRTHTN